MKKKKKRKPRGVHFQVINIVDSAVLVDLMEYLHTFTYTKNYFPKVDHYLSSRNTTHEMSIKQGLLFLNNDDEIISLKHH